MSYESLKIKYPLLNWKEAEEATQDELDAALQYFNKNYNGNNNRQNNRTIQKN